MNLPSRPAYTEKAFRKYESIIIQILSNYPSPSTLTPGNVSAETFSHRLRDAIKAVGYSDWNTPIDKPFLRGIFEIFSESGTWVINRTSSSIIAGPPYTKSTSPSKVQALNISTLAEEDIISCKNKDEIFKAFLVLLNAEVLKGPVKLTHVKDVGEADRYPNIVVVYTPTHIVLL